MPIAGVIFGGTGRTVPGVGVRAVNVSDGSQTMERKSLLAVAGVRDAPVAIVEGTSMRDVVMVELAVEEASWLLAEL